MSQEIQPQQSAAPTSPSPANVSQPPPVRLPLHRPPLRAKTGCLKCRKRRKKCDEQKPVCGDCTRLRFTCVWPDGISRRPVPPTTLTSSTSYLSQVHLSTHSTAYALSTTHYPVLVPARAAPIDDCQSSSGSSRVAESSSGSSSPESPSRSTCIAKAYPRPSLARGSQKAIKLRQAGESSRFGLGSICQQMISNIHVRNDMEYSLLDKSPIILNMLICPTADASCRDFTSIFQVALQEQWIRDSMLAFAASIMANSMSEGPMSLEAGKLYQKAIVGLRRNIEVDAKDSYKQHMLLVSVNFLGLLETLCSEEPDRPLVHFVASAKLLSLLRRSQNWNTSNSINAFYRIMVEDAVYNTACLALFSSAEALDRLSTQINFVDLESFFPAYRADDGVYYTSNYRTSPFLGGQRDIYYLMFDIAHFARQDVSETHKRKKLTRFSTQLHVIEAGINSLYDTNVPSAVREKYVDKYRAHALCLRIWIAKIENTNRCSSSPEIRRHVADCLKILKTKELLEHMNPALCWVMEVLFTAVYTSEEWETVRTFALELRAIIDKGHGDRMIRMLQLVEEIRNHGPETCDGLSGATCAVDHDGLGLLMRKEGIFQNTRT